jgi:hypothetical protein
MSDFAIICSAGLPASQETAVHWTTGHLDGTKARKVALPNLKPMTKTISQAAFSTSTSRSSLPAMASLATSRS